MFQSATIYICKRCTYFASFFFERFLSLSLFLFICVLLPLWTTLTRFFSLGRFSCCVVHSARFAVFCCRSHRLVRILCVCVWFQFYLSFVNVCSLSLVLVKMLFSDVYPPHPIFVLHRSLLPACLVRFGTVRRVPAFGDTWNTFLAIWRDLLAVQSTSFYFFAWSYSFLSFSHSTQIHSLAEFTKIVHVPSKASLFLFCINILCRTLFHIIV